MTRVPYATRENMDAAGQAVWDDIETSRGGVARNYAALLNNPRASGAMAGLGGLEAARLAVLHPKGLQHGRRRHGQHGNRGSGQSRPPLRSEGCGRGANSPSDGSGGKRHLRRGGS